MGAFVGGWGVLKSFPWPAQKCLLVSGQARHVLLRAAGSLCSPSALPAGTDTFKQMYIADGNHPSIAGTYLEGLIIASSITGQTHRNDTF